MQRSKLVGRISEAYSADRSPCLATCVRDWPYSSFHRDVQAGLFPEDLAGDSNANGDFGEWA
jgi:hypothetical protein